ncbi:MAG: hypothetical protein RLZZ230_335 [Candidatus Parcubacteria bacterium]|jgi:hypothetical protein
MNFFKDIITIVQQTTCILFVLFIQKHNRGKKWTH